MSLTQPDIDKAKLFYLEHLDHVSQLMHDSKEETCYPPTDTYDQTRSVETSSLEMVLDELYRQ